MGWREGRRPVGVALREGLTVVAFVAVVAGCGSPAESAQSPSVVVGSGSSAVSAVLAEIYAGALRRGGLEAGVESVGSGAATVDALAAGSVDLLPVFSGDLLSELDPESAARTPDDVFEAVNRSLPEWLSVSDYAGAENRESVTVSAATAESLSSATLTDLASSCGSLTVAVPDDDSAADVLDPLRETYGCAFGSQTIAADIDAVRNGLRNNAFGVAVLSATDLGSDVGGDGGDVTLADTDAAYTAQNVLPLFRKGLLDEKPSLAVGVVAGELTTADLADMVARVRSGDSASIVAESWLSERSF